MKTKIYLSTLLALIIQVMVNGQTPGNQASQSRPQSKLTPVLKHNHTSGSSRKEVAEAKSVIVVQDKVVVNTTPSPSSTSQTLKQQADDLSLKSKTLMVAAQNAKGLVKTELISEATELLEQAQQMQITALELSGKKNHEAYQLNKSNLNQLLETSSVSAYAGKQAQSLISDADMNMRLATEMREEAYAMPTQLSKIGSMSNADEKEVLALGEQTEAIHILKTYAYNNSSAGIDLNSYAAK